MHLACGEDHAGGPTVTAEAALTFPQKTLFQMVVQAVEENASEDLPGDVQQGGVSVVVTELAVTFPFIEMHDCGVLQILREFSLTPHLEERRQLMHELLAIVLVDLGRDCVRPGRFPAGELLHGPDGFVER
ncbi:hypothetical protein SprV_0100335200 [Sparganum proliferum]